MLSPSISMTSGTHFFHPIFFLQPRTASALPHLLLICPWVSVGARLAAAVGVSSGGDGVPMGQGQVHVRFEFLEARAT